VRRLPEDDGGEAPRPDHLPARRPPASPGPLARPPAGPGTQVVPGHAGAALPTPFDPSDEEDP
jgi:hypothetical protein